MASSLICALAVTTPGSDTPLPPVTGSEHAGLVEALGRIPDPRNPHGTRYSLVALLTVAVCVVLAGATSFAAIIDWLYDLDEPDQQRLGFTRGVQAGTTMWRLLTRLDASLLSAVLAGWLRSRKPPAPTRPRRYRTVPDRPPAHIQPFSSCVAVGISVPSRIAYARVGCVASRCPGRRRPR